MPKERLIPQDVAAEQSVLGALLIDPQVKLEINGLLAEHFYKEAHKAIFTAIMEVEAPDVVTVARELTKRKLLPEVGGSAYLARLVSVVPTSIHAAHYSRIVQRTALLRDFLTLPSRITDLVYSEAGDGEEVWDRIRAAVEAVRPEVEQTNPNLAWKPSLDYYVDVQLNRFEETTNTEEVDQPLLNFPWQALSGPGKIRRLRPGTLSTVAAQTKFGKTAFAECCSEYWAKAGFHVVFLHAELSHEIMLDRRACRHTDFNMEELDAGVRFDVITKLHATLGAWPGEINYVHCPGWTVERLTAFCERMMQSSPVDVVVVDFFQKLAYSANRFDLTSAQARGQQVEAIKAMAERMGIPVLLLSQLNRAKQIRDTGELEERCNLLVEIDRPILKRNLFGPNGLPIAYKGDPDPRAFIRVKLNTFGGTWTDKMFIEGPRYLWGDMTSQKEDKEEDDD